MTDTLIDWLEDVPDDHLGSVGGKAANLVRLLRLGLPVPPGFVVTTTAYLAFLAANGLMDVNPAQLRERIIDAPLPPAMSTLILEAYQRLGASAVAVRSSATAEDLATASFAGQYDTVLDVSGSEELLLAVKTCWASMWAPRAVAYRREAQAFGEVAAGQGALALAVVIQRMVPAEAAGVAFSANPVTGSREEVVINAVHGLGERLVSGEATADEWLVRGTEAVCQRSPEAALNSDQARAIAGMARRIAEHFGAPQDVEWAVSGGQLYVLQARPITALPDPVEWRAAAPGGWLRNFRVGEWLPEPVTPLFESWLLADIEEGEVAAEARDFGVHRRPPYHVTVNGWYFSSPIGGGLPVSSVLTLLLRHPRALLAFVLSLSRPQVADRVLLSPREHAWRTELLPRYQRVVAAGHERIAVATPQELIRLIDDVAAVAGDYLWVFSMVGGHAWKVERALARFYRKHLFRHLGGSHQELLRGLATIFPEPPAHAVQSLDWIRPTLGESPAVVAAGTGNSSPDLDTRRRRMADGRRSAETACRAALAARPRLLHRFDALLALAQRYAVIREEQAGWFTLAWPLLRRAVLRLGHELSLRDIIAQGEDVFFLTRSEVDAGLTGERQDLAQRSNMRARVIERRREWERQRRLTPPLVIGKPPGAALLAGAAEAMRVPAAGGRSSHETLKGMPSSPGRATGAARLVRGPDDFMLFQPGEVLVAQVTTPAWTPLFERAAAVITDGGSVAAHASLVAREYGIPAVVGTGDATARLRDGQIVTVDGSAGVVELRP